MERKGLFAHMLYLILLGLCCSVSACVRLFDECPCSVREREKRCRAQGNRARLGRSSLVGMGKTRLALASLFFQSHHMFCTFIAYLLREVPALLALIFYRG